MRSSSPTRSAAATAWLQDCERRLGPFGEADELAELEQDARLELLVTAGFRERLAPERDGFGHSTCLGSNSSEPEQHRGTGRARRRLLARRPDKGHRPLEVTGLEVPVGRVEPPALSPLVVGGRSERDGLFCELGRRRRRPAGASMPCRGVQCLGRNCALGPVAASAR